MAHRAYSRGRSELPQPLSLALAAPPPYAIFPFYPIAERPGEDLLRRAQARSPASRLCRSELLETVQPHTDTDSGYLPELAERRRLAAAAGGNFIAAESTAAGGGACAEMLFCPGVRRWRVMKCRCRSRWSRRVGQHQNMSPGIARNISNSFRNAVSRRTIYRAPKNRENHHFPPPREMQGTPHCDQSRHQTKTLAAQNAGIE